MRDRSLFTNAASLAVCGVLAGVVVAAAAFPAIAVGGLAVKAGADSFHELPTELNVLPSPQLSWVYASDGKTLLATIYDENRFDVPLADVSQVMRDAIIAAEDTRFYEHRGVDFQGIMRAFVANQSGDQQGASTLTMQYVRQALTYSASSPTTVIEATEKTNARKLREAKYALSIETILTKDQILERYLNISAFGNGAYGIRAASLVYFGKLPKDLKVEEAALLAGLVKAPTSFDPTTKAGKPRAKDRRDYIINQMAAAGKITQAHADAAKATEVKVTGKRTPNGCFNASKNHWGFFCDYVLRWWNQQKEFGPDESQREGRLKSGGYRIITTLDVQAQEAAQRNVEAQVPKSSSDALVLAAVEPGSGHIKAMAVNRTFGLDESKNKPSSDPVKRKAGVKGTYPTTANPLISGGGDVAGYQAGSTFKLFTMIAALEKGYTLDTEINAVSPYQSKYIVGGGEKNDSTCPDAVHWCPKNSTPSYMNGRQTMWTGFGKSVNTYFVPLLERVGADKAVDVSKRLGIKYRAAEDAAIANDPRRASTWGPFTLGVTSTVPLELANAYATLAADGKYCEPMPVLQITDLKGKKLTNVTKTRCKQVVKPEIARAAIDAARCSVYDKSAFGACVQAGTGNTYLSGNSGDTQRVAQAVDRPVAGKTGTTNNNWTANLVITTKQLAIAGQLANPDYFPTPHHATKAPLAVNTAVAFTMRDALKGKPKTNFTAPPESIAFGKKVSVPSVTCQPVAEATSRLRGAGFDVVVDARQVASSCPAGTVATTDPSGRAPKDGVILLVVSNGQSGQGATPGPGGPGGTGGPPRRGIVPGGGDGGADGTTPGPGLFGVLDRLSGLRAAD